MFGFDIGHALAKIFLYSPQHSKFTLRDLFYKKINNMRHEEFVGNYLGL
jgi:hypothetical protein